MVRLPARLEHRLSELFPRVRERERFVADIVEHALDDAEKERSATHRTVAVGGTIHLFTDGGSRGNPGQAAVGCVLIDPASGTVMEEYKERIGINTNNVAEYQALIAGLRLARKYSPNRLVCHLDSELVVKQLSGEYRVKMQSLQPLVDEIHELTQELGDVRFVYVPRADNFRADKLVNEALDGR